MALNRMKKLIAVLGFMLCVALGFAQDNFVAMKDVPDFKAKLQSSSSKLTTIESNFTQEKKMNMLTKKNISTGHFYYKKENSIRWEYLQPTKYLIVIKNGVVTVKDDTKTKQIDTQSNRQFKELNSFILSCVQGSILQNTKDYSFSYFENASQWFVKLVPLNAKMKKMLAEINLYFDRKDLSVVCLKMVEQGGDYTAINFTDKKINASVSDDMFIIQ